MKKKDKNSNEDQKYWEEFLKDPRDIFDKDINLKTKVKKNLKLKFDFHGYNLADANKKVKSLILDCYKKGIMEVLLITGKGIHSNTYEDAYKSENYSKLKFSIPDYINSEPELMSKIIEINTAEKKSGGEGALLVRIKKTTK